eukprot:gene25829-biopygen19525
MRCFRRALLRGRPMREQRCCRPLRFHVLTLWDVIRPWNLSAGVPPTDAAVICRGADRVPARGTKAGAHMRPCPPWSHRTLARAWRGHGAGVARAIGNFRLGWRGRGAGMAQACSVTPGALSQSAFGGFPPKPYAPATPCIAWVFPPSTSRDISGSERRSGGTKLQGKCVARPRF